MEIQDKAQFLQILSRTMAAYGKPTPDTQALAVWWDMLTPFPLRAVAMAFASYLDENGEFAPVPAGIAKRCKLMDGRPSDDEAWAIALTGRAEEDTVVWTAETAEAFGLCQSVLAMGDEVGARMAFKDAYNRLVAAARLANQPCQWRVSEGWNRERREIAVQKAVQAGLLAAPKVKTLLPNYTDTKADPSPEGLKRVKEALAVLQDGWKRRDEARAAELAAERERTQQRKQDLAAQADRLRELGNQADQLRQQLPK